MLPTSNRRHFLSMLPIIPVATLAVIKNDRNGGSDVNILDAVERLINRANNQQMFRATLVQVFVSNYVSLGGGSWTADYGPWRIQRTGFANPDDTGYPLFGSITIISTNPVDPGGNGWKDLDATRECIVFNVGGQLAIGVQVIRTAHV